MQSEFIKPIDVRPHAMPKETIHYATENAFLRYRPTPGTTVAALGGSWVWMLNASEDRANTTFTWGLGDNFEQAMSNLKHSPTAGKPHDERRYLVVELKERPTTFTGLLDTMTKDGYRVLGLYEPEGGS